MTDLDSALRPWQKLFDKYQPDTEIRHGFIGDGNGTVNVVAFPGWSWIRYDDIQSKLSMVRNHRYGLLPDGTPIVVGKRHHTDKYEQVLRVDFAAYASGMDEDTINQYILAPHGISHRGLGSDPAPIDLNNLVFGKVIPDDPASLSVEIYSAVYEHGCEVSLYAGEVLDLTAYVPPAAGTHRYVLVYLDQATGAAGVVVGDIGAAPAGPPVIPDALPGTIPLAIVILIQGQTEILIADIIQWKLLLGAACGTVGVHTHSDDTTGGTSLIGIEEFMFSCHDPIFLVGNAIWPTEVYHELHISTMYDGLDVEADLIWIHADPIHGCGQILILKVADPAMYTTYSVNVRHGVGNIWLSGGDVTLDEGTDHLWLIYDGQYWCNDVGRVVAGVSGSGVANQVAYWSAVNTIAGDAGFTYDPATDTITLTGGIDITPFGVGDDQIITITPSAALTTIAAEWDGIAIDGAALDPSVGDVEIHGIHIDFSGVSIANLPHIDAVHILTPTTHHGHGHGIHLDGLGMRVDHDDTAAAAGETHTIIDVIIDDAGSTGGMTHALDVARVGGGAIDIAAVGTHTGVDPIHQHVGAFAGSAKAWRYVAIGPAWTDATAEFDGGVNLQIFAADNDVIYISGTADDTMFDEIEVILTIASSKHIHPVFEYSVGGPAWTQFYPADDTDGFQDDGIIRFDSDDLAGWARIDVNAEGTNRYWIRITRTRNNIAIPPTEATIRVLLPTRYYWNELGNLSILGMVAAADLDVAGHAAFGGDASILANHIVAAEETFTANAGIFRAMRFVASRAPTANFTGDTVGIIGRATLTTAWVQTADAIIGVRGSATIADTIAGTALTLVGGHFTADAEDGTAINAVAINAETPRVDTGAVTTGYGLRIIQSPLGVGGAINTLYGIYIHNINVGGSNWAFYSAGGRVEVSGGDIRIDDGQKYLSDTSVATDNAIYVPAATGRWSIDSAGNVYINLDIDNNSSAGHFSVFNDAPDGAGTLLFRVQENGNVGIATIPDRRFHAEVADAVTAAITYAERLSHTTSGTAAPLFGIGVEHELEDAGGAMQVASEITTLWAAATAGSESPLYRGTTYPKGVAGPGYWGFWTWMGIDNNAVIMIPNGAGDVTSGLTATYRLSESGGGVDGNVITVDNGTGVDLYDDGVDVCTLTVAADGSVTVVRSAGATTFDLSILICWL